MVSQTFDKDSAFLPVNGCAGPVAIDLPGIRLVAMDTDFWINDRVEWISSCKQSDENLFLQALDSLLKTAGDREVIIAAHHPVQTNGTHGGFYDWQDHIFPLTREVRWLWLPL